MSYLNTFKLIQCVLERKRPDAKAFLEEVDEHKIIASLKRSKDGLPQPIKWTTEPVEEENFAKLSVAEKKKIHKIFQRVYTEPTKQIPILLQLKEKHPNLPVLYNYLGVAYEHSQQPDKCKEILHDTVKLFPDYLFGKITLAEYHLKRGNHRKVRTIFNNKLEIHYHFPASRTTYHISEVRSFHSIIGTLHARSGNMTRAIFCYLLLQKIDPDHPLSLRLGNEILLKELSKISRKQNRSRQS
jgi:tetratricopeptide (TPR) repeat protein